MIKSSLETLISDPSKGWEFHFEADGFKIYRRQREGSADGLCEYRAIGKIQNILPEIVYKVYMDEKFRQKYDSNQGQTIITHLPLSDECPDKQPTSHNGAVDDTLDITSTTTSDDDDNKGEILQRQLVEWVVKYPWPLKDRLYLFERTSLSYPQNPTFDNLSLHNNTSTKIFHVHCKSKIREPGSNLLDKAPSIIERYPNHVVVEEYTQNWIFYSLPIIPVSVHVPNQSDGKGNDGGSSGKAPVSTGVIMTYFENGASGIPSSVLQWGLQRGIPVFIKSLTSACVDYAKSLEKEAATAKLDSEKSIGSVKPLKSHPL